MFPASNLHVVCQLNLYTESHRDLQFWYAVLRSLAGNYVLGHVLNLKCGLVSLLLNDSNNLRKTFLPNNWLQHGKIMF